MRPRRTSCRSVPPESKSAHRIDFKLTNGLPVRDDREYIDGGLVESGFARAAEEPFAEPSERRQNGEDVAVIARQNRVWPALLAVAAIQRIDRFLEPFGCQAANGTSGHGGRKWMPADEEHRFNDLFVGWRLLAFNWRGGRLERRRSRGDHRRRVFFGKIGNLGVQFPRGAAELGRRGLAQFQWTRFRLRVTHGEDRTRR